MKATRKLSSYVLLSGIMGLSIVGGITAYQIYSASVKNQATAEQTAAIKPLDGVINQATIDGLKKRTVYTDTQMELLLNASPTPLPEASPSGEQTGETESVTDVILTPTPLPEASPSGEQEAPIITP